MEKKVINTIVEHIATKYELLKLSEIIGRCAIATGRCITQSDHIAQQRVKISAPTTLPFRQAHGASLIIQKVNFHDYNALLFQQLQKKVV